MNKEGWKEGRKGVVRFKILFLKKRKRNHPYLTIISKDFRKYFSVLRKLMISRSMKFPRISIAFSCSMKPYYYRLALDDYLL